MRIASITKCKRREGATARAEKSGRRRIFYPLLDEREYVVRTTEGVFSGFQRDFPEEAQEVLGKRFLQNKI